MLIAAKITLFIEIKDHQGDVLSPKWKVLDEARVTEPVAVTIRVDHHSILSFAKTPSGEQVVDLSGSDPEKILAR